MTPIESLIFLAALLFVKHFAADGPLQTGYQVAHKGRFLHPAGLAHAGLHAALTAVCLGVWAALVDRDAVFGGWTQMDVALVLSLIIFGEFVVHYLTDYAKCAVDARYRWSSAEAGPDGQTRLIIENTKAYFTAFLLDQLAHALTYVAITLIVLEVFVIS